MHEVHAYEESRLIATREQALAEGIEQGVAKGSVIGKIQLLQQLLDDSETEMPELFQLGDAELSSMLSDLQDRLRSRGG